jgi:LysM repeat protein
VSSDSAGGGSDNSRPPITLAALQAEVRFLRAVVLLAIVILLVLFAALRVGGCAGPPRAILVDGKIVAYVRDHQAAERVRRGLIQTAAKGFPGPAALKERWQDVQPQVLRPDDAVKLLQGQVHVLVRAISITVNGKPVVAVPNEAAAEQVQAACLARFTPQGERLLAQPRFKEKFAPAPADVAAEDIFRDPAKAAQFLVTAPAPRQYVVQSGDFPDRIARRFGLSLRAFLALNPGLRGTTLRAGQQVIIAESRAPLTVITVRQVSERQPVPPPEKRTASPALPKGQSKVTDPGAPGEKSVVLRAVFENDKRVKVSPISEQVTKAPKARTVEYGTGPAQGQEPGH